MVRLAQAWGYTAHKINRVAEQHMADTIASQHIDPRRETVYRWQGAWAPSTDVVSEGGAEGFFQEVRVFTEFYSQTSHP